jgi:acyl-CoA thioester hydrolase
MEEDGEGSMTEIRVYYEDTDAGGVVYHAKYLRYLEQGRTEYLRERGLSVRELQEQGYLLPLVHLEIDYLAPAVLDDLLRVETAVLEVTGATFTLGQKAVRVSDGKLLIDAKVTLACIESGKGARRLPEGLVRAIKGEVLDRGGGWRRAAKSRRENDRDSR